MFTTFFLFLMSFVPFHSPHQNPPPTPPEITTPQPCADAKTPQASNDCFSNLYEQSDAQLNIAYNKVVDSMNKNLAQAQRDNAPTRITHHQSALTKLLAAQRAWLTYRDANCDSVRFQYEGGSLQPTIWSQCMLETTQQRIATLSTAYDLSN